MQGGEYTFRCTSADDEWDQTISAGSEDEARRLLWRILGAGRRIAVQLVSGPSRGSSSALSTNIRRRDSQPWLFNVP
jgi:alkylation response protein AidB-like acyl-CoA dehydrogenase